MIKFKSIQLKNIVFFKDVTFNFKAGISVIRGLNRNAKNLAKSPNGVGKSLLMGAIPNIVHATTPLSTKKNDKRAIFEKDGSVRFKMDNGKTKYDITQYSKGKSTEYILVKNGVDTQTRTATIVEDKMKTEIFPLSEDLFYSTVFLSVQRFPAFLRGTPAQRQEFFTEIFNLDHYDRVRAQLNTQIKELKAKGIKLETVVEQFDDVNRNLKKLDWSVEKDKELRLLNEKQSVLNQVFLEQNSDLDELKNYLVLAKRIQHLQHKLGDNVDDELSKLQEKQKVFEKQLKTLNAYNEYRRAEKKYQRDIDELESKLKSLKEEAEEVKEDGELEDVNGRITKLEDRRDILNSRASAIKRLRDKYVRLQAALPDKKPSRSVSELIGRIGELEQIIKIHKVINNVLNGNGDSGSSNRASKTCPLCQSKIDSKIIARIAGDALKELPKREAELDAAKGHAELKRIHKEATEFTSSEEQLADIENKLDKLYKKKKRLEKYDRVRSAIRDCKHTIGRINKPTVVDKPSSKLSDDDLEQQIKVFTNLIAYRKELDSAILEEKKTHGQEKSAKDLESEIAELEKKQRKLSKQINHVNETLPTLLADQKRYQQLTESKTELQKRMDSMKKSLSDLPVLQALVKAYSSKGLKVAKLKQISELVENNLNLYAPLIFAEKSKFNINITENDFSILIDRGHNKISDIRRLSGAESSCFNLLLLLAVLPLIPNARRVDTIILDEMDAFFGEPIKELYAQKFLPMLQTIVPKICVITTSKTLKFAEAQNYLIVKEGDESRIEELGELTGLL